MICVSLGRLLLGAELVSDVICVSLERALLGTELVSDVICVSLGRVLLGVTGGWQQDYSSSRD